MKSAVLKKLCVGTLLCLIVLLTMFAWTTVCVAEEAPTEDGSAATDQTTQPSDEPADEGLGLHFDKDNVIASLNIMWKGVLAIFITIAIIIVVSVVMNKACNAASESIKKRQKKIEDDLRNNNTDGQS